MNTSSIAITTISSSSPFGLNSPSSQSQNNFKNGIPLQIIPDICPFLTCSEMSTLTSINRVWTPIIIKVALGEPTLIIRFAGFVQSHFKHKLSSEQLGVLLDIVQKPVADLKNLVTIRAIIRDLKKSILETLQILNDQDFQICLQNIRNKKLTINYLEKIFLENMFTSVLLYKQLQMRADILVVDSAKPLFKCICQNLLTLQPISKAIKITSKICSGSNSNCVRMIASTLAEEGYVSISIDFVTKNKLLRGNKLQEDIIVDYVFTGAIQNGFIDQIIAFVKLFDDIQNQINASANIIRILLKQKNSDKIFEILKMVYASYVTKINSKFESSFTSETEHLERLFSRYGREAYLLLAMEGKIDKAIQTAEMAEPPLKLPIIKEILFTAIEHGFVDQAIASINNSVHATMSNRDNRILILDYLLESLLKLKNVDKAIKIASMIQEKKIKKNTLSKILETLEKQEGYPEQIAKIQNLLHLATTTSTSVPVTSSCCVIM